MHAFVREVRRLRGQGVRNEHGFGFGCGCGMRACRLQTSTTQTARPQTPTRLAVRGSAAAAAPSLVRQLRAGLEFSALLR